MSAAPKRPTKAELAEYVTTRRRRLEISREADALERHEKTLRRRIEAWFQRAASDREARLRGLKLLGFFIRAVSRAGRVDWKAQYIDVAGQERALELARQAPDVESIQIDALA